jgi:nickel superoxide dismutase
VAVAYSLPAGAQYYEGPVESAGPHNLPIKCKEISAMRKAHSLVLCTALVIAGLLAVPLMVSAHCEVPCGIYGDGNRFSAMREDIATIEKAMKQITALSTAGKKNYNQLVRWINTKEMHANKLQETVWQYFLTQRIKPVSQKDPAYPAYLKKLKLLHHLSVYAMKAKQSTNLDVVKKLKMLVDQFQKAYMKKKK